MKYKPSAGLLMARPEDGAILLTRRSQNVSLPGLWGIPGGGVEEGETYLDAAIREAKEEVGGVPHVYIHTRPFFYSKPGLLYATFLAILSAGQAWEPVLNDENDAWGWFLGDDLPVPILTSAKRAIDGLEPLMRDSFLESRPR